MKNEATIDPRAASANHWLQGFSAARLGKPAEPRDEQYAASYHSGYRRGSS